jgi:hypothetical protein
MISGTEELLESRLGSDARRGQMLKLLVTSVKRFFVITALVVLVAHSAPAQSRVRFAHEFPSVQSAINSLPAGGGTIYLQCGASYVGPTTIPNGVDLESDCPSMYSTTLGYSALQSIGPATGIALRGVKLVFTGSSNLILSSVIQSHFDMEVTCATGSPCVLLTTSGFNSVANRFDFLKVTTGGEIGVQLAATGDQFFTDNDFHQVFINMTRSSLGPITEALGFTRNCDSNHFGSVHLFFTNVTAGIGVIFNDSNTPSIETGADNEVLGLVDITSGRAINGMAYVVNASTGNTWTEGFGQSGFTTSISADPSTHFFRFELNGSGIALGQSGIVSRPGATASYLTLPSTGSQLVSDTASQAITNKRLQLSDEGTCTMRSGTCAPQNLSTHYGTAPKCFANWTGMGTLTGVLKVPSTTSVVTPASSVRSDTAQVNWACFGN